MSDAVATAVGIDAVTPAETGRPIGDGEPVAEAQHTTATVDGANQSLPSVVELSSVTITDPPNASSATLDTDPGQAVQLSTETGIAMDQVDTGETEPIDRAESAKEMAVAPPREHDKGDPITTAAGDTVETPKDLEAEAPVPDFELAPLPTLFDPDADPSPADGQITYEPDPFGLGATGSDGEDEDRLETGEGQPDEVEEDLVEAPGEGEEEDEGMMMEYITSLQQYEGAPGDDEEVEEVEQIEQAERDEGGENPEQGQGDMMQSEGQEQGEEQPQPDDAPPSEGVTNGTQADEPTETIVAASRNDKEGSVQDGPGREENKAKDVDMPSARSSPLTPVSDIPELPDVLSLSPIQPIKPLPAPLKATAAPDLPRDPTPAKSPSKSDDAAVPHAESSSAAQRRGLQSPSPVSLAVGNGSPLNGATKRAPTVNKKKLDAASGIKISDKPPDKIAPRPKAFTDVQIKKLLHGQTRELQLAQCQRPRYAKWGKCTQCIAKVGGDSCRFRDYRTFEIDPETTDIKGPGWFESTEWKEEMTPLPKVFNRRLEEKHIVRSERTVAPILLPLITNEVRHVVSKKAIHRGVDAAKHRSVCDFCSSTIFGGWFFCKRCGRDFCLQCERYFPESFETITKSPWAMPDAARPRLLRCHHQVIPGAAPPKGPAFHLRSDLQPVSRFGEEELRDHWLRLAEFVLEGKEPLGDRLKLMGLAEEEDVNKVVEEFPGAAVASDVDPALQGAEKDGNGEVRPQDKDFKYTKTTHPSAIPIPDPADLADESREFLFVCDDDLSNEVFDLMWTKGEPMVVDHVGDSLRLEWKPDNFIEWFGKEQCYVVNCQTDDSQPTTVGRFFQRFKNREERGDKILKLKDWPSTDDFQNTHPDLYHDFCDALPVPDYTRREGVLNLYAHFPPGPTRPDIGPKMYNAFEALETPGGFGSTRLHMDVADAVNLLTYASDRSDGQPGCAVWDLFRAEDAGLIREYLREKFEKTHVFTDPIHSQLFYLDSSMRRELFEKKGVRGWRVYQYPGQAVFIPAGCAHQVCNLADCIKIALDFVSPHNVRRCQQLTQDFRRENFVKAWKEDVLQLYNVLWYAWLSCQETRQRNLREAEEEKIALAAREAHLASLRNGQHQGFEESSSFGRMGSPMAMPLPSAGLGLGGGWNVSSVRDEPYVPSRSPSVSRGGSPVPVLPSRNRVEADELVAAEDSEKAGANKSGPSSDTEGDKQRVEDVGVDGTGESTAQNGKEEKVVAESKRKLAEGLLSITLKRELPPPSEAFTPSSALAASRKNISLPVPTAVIKPTVKDMTSITPAALSPAPRNGKTSASPKYASASRSSSPNPSRQANLVARQKEAERKEREKREQRVKNAPRGLRTSTLIKLGAKRFDDVMGQAKGEMLGELGEGMLKGIGEEAWSALKSSSPTPPRRMPDVAEIDPHRQVSGFDFGLGSLGGTGELGHESYDHLDSPMTVDMDFSALQAEIDERNRQQEQEEAEGQGVYGGLDADTIGSLLGHALGGDPDDFMGQVAGPGTNDEDDDMNGEGARELAAQLSMLQQTEEEDMAVGQGEMDDEAEDQIIAESGYTL
ncbi:hypothetical protein IAU60_001963 [Kwoniella sp. DSM 27419]